MSNVKVWLTYDPTGRNPDNLISGESHELAAINGFPYKIVTMEHGGFYARSLRVYDASYTPMVLDVDYIVTYRYANVSTRLGLEVCSDVVFLNKNQTGNVYLSAQMVGGDIAFSLTSVIDYIDWYDLQPADYIPRSYDFNGNEPVWAPGELERERWHLDTYQPFNNEIYELSRAVSGATGTYEQDFRDKVTNDYNDFLDRFNDRLQRHIDDKLNPHVDLKGYIGLPLVENYALADEVEARTGTANNLYLTPLRSWQLIDQKAVQPMNTHIQDLSNPHQTTPEKIGAPTKVVVDETAATKYFSDETVVNTNYFTDTILDYTYSDYYQYARKDIPAANFAVGGTNGYIPPSRLGRGPTNDKTVLRSDGQWVSWDTIIVERGNPPSPNIVLLGAFGSAQAGHNYAMSLPAAWTAPIGSLFFYTVYTQYWWGTGNGGLVTGHQLIYGSYKTANGWIIL